MTIMSFEIGERLKLGDRRRANKPGREYKKYLGKPLQELDSSAPYHNFGDHTCDNGHEFAVTQWDGEKCCGNRWMGGVQGGTGGLGSIAAKGIERRETRLGDSVGAQAGVVWVMRNKRAILKGMLEKEHLG